MVLRPRPIRYKHVGNLRTPNPGVLPASKWPSWVNRGATLDLDFVNGRAFEYPTERALTDVLATTRASEGYADDTSGVFSLFGSGVPRITNKGILVEPSRTNSIRNNSMQGASAPSTVPTNWSFVGGTGLSVSYAFGTENGVEYMDVTLAGTAGGTFAVLFLEAALTIAASNGQSWAYSGFASLRAGSLSGITTSMQVRQTNGVGAQLSDLLAALITGPTSTLTRYGGVVTTNNASVAALIPYLAFSYANGSSINFTLRLGWPQLELGDSITSPIRSTSSATTRAADVVTVNNFSRWFANPPAYTQFGDFTIPGAISAGTFPVVFGFWNGADVLNNRTFIGLSVSSNKRGGGNTFAGGSNKGRLDSVAAFVANTPTKNAYAITANERSLVVDGAAAVTSSVSGLPTGLSAAGVGHESSGSQLTGYIRRLSFFPARLTNARMQQLTQ